jgi:type II secretory pathway pseudopilin PulG
MRLSKKPKKYYFSLTELLVVIAVIAILVSLLFPALTRVVYNSKKIVCSNNLKLQAAGLITYTEDNNYFYPHADHRSRSSYLSMMYSQNEVRWEIRPYWGISMYIDNWGKLFPDTTDIERCPLRKDPHDELYVRRDPNEEKHVNRNGNRYLNYLYYYNYGGVHSSKTPLMRRIGEYNWHDGNNPETATVVDSLISDIMVDRRSRSTNHHELHPGFEEKTTGGYRYSWEFKTGPFLPPISANFAGQDGSVADYILPLSPLNIWWSTPDFTRNDWDVWVPNRFVKKANE